MTFFADRRRFLGMAAALAAIPLTQCLPQTADTLPEPVLWQGIALGSGAQMRLYHADRPFAEQLVRRALVEVARLEKIFSLYRDDSLLVRLNRNGRLDNPPADLLTVLSLCRRFHRLTGGAFDPSIQPLWQFYADHFARYPNGSVTPDERRLKQILTLVDFSAVSFDSRSIRFAKPGMALSLNGIAQGYITDCIAALLQQAGVHQALIDFGEIRAFDTTHTHSWQAGIRDPRNEKNVLLDIPLQNRALATSGGYGTPLDESSRFTHLFDPRTGNALPAYLSVSVAAPDAASADALATAFSVMEKNAIAAVLPQLPDTSVWLLMPGGNIENL